MEIRILCGRMMVINRWLTQKKKAMMIKTLRYMMLGAVLVMAGTSCSDNDEYDNPSRPVEPGVPTSVRTG